MSAGFGVGQRHVGDSLTTERRIDGTVVRQNAAMAVVRVRTKANVDDEKQFGKSLT